MSHGENDVGKQRKSTLRMLCLLPQIYQIEPNIIIARRIQLK